MTPIKRLVASTGKYTNRDGEEKSRWVQVGTMFKDGDKLSIKIDSLPVGQGWSGWINVYDVEEKKQEPPKQADAFDDEIPY